MITADAPADGAPVGSPSPPLAPSLWRRLMWAAYEGVILFGIYVFVGLLVLPLMQWSGVLGGTRLAIYQVLLLLAFGTYFTYCWHRSGQTLPMRTLQVRVQRRDGTLLSTGRAWARYLLSWSGLLAGAAILAVEPRRPVEAFAAFALATLALQAGAAFGPRRQALHDRWLDTEVVRVPD